MNLYLHFNWRINVEEYLTFERGRDSATGLEGFKRFIQYAGREQRSIFSIHFYLARG